MCNFIVNDDVCDILVREFPDVLTNKIGKFNKELISIQLKPDARPVFLVPRVFYRGHFSRDNFPATIFPKTIFPYDIFTGDNVSDDNFPAIIFPATILPRHSFYQNEKLKRL